MGDPPPMLGSDTIVARAAASEQIYEAQRRARNRTAEQFQTIDDPADVPIRRRGEGFGPGRGFLERAAPREAAARLDDEFPRQDLGPDSVRRTDSGEFAPTERTRRTEVAREFEATTALGDVDPFGDLTAQDGGGFGLAIGPQRELAARDLDPQFPAVDIGADDVERADGGAFGLTPDAERAVGAERLEAQTPLDEVGPGDVRRTEGGFELRDSVIEANRGLFR